MKCEIQEKIDSELNLMIYDERLSEAIAFAGVHITLFGILANHPPIIWAGLFVTSASRLPISISQARMETVIKLMETLHKKK